MIEKHRVKLLSVVLLLLSEPISSRTRTENRFDSIRGSDSLLVARCDIKCHDSREQEEILNECHNTCMSMPYEKHGRCPDTFENLTPFAQACLNFCYGDAACPGTEKCCRHSCGSTCKPAVDLEDDDDLPPVPEDLTAAKKKKGVLLSWTMPKYSSNDLILFVVQERHHLGAFFNELLLGEWNPIHSTFNTTAILKSILKPGHFYQFRIASVNVNGSRGFSTPSKAFTLARPPKLQRPKNLRVEEIRERNGTVWATVRWRPAKSSIPIEKYKILWSFKLDEDLYKYNSDSLITQRTTVPEHRQYYQLRDLKKNKMYYIQVQAVASYGQEVIKSNKAQMVLDTSKLENQYEMDQRRMIGKYLRI